MPFQANSNNVLVLDEWEYCILFEFTALLYLRQLFLHEQYVYLVLA